MKTKFIKLFCVYLCIFVYICVWSQCRAESLKIGGENTLSNSMTSPFSPFYKYSFSQTIYTKQELAPISGKQITELSYFTSTDNINNITQYVEIYINYTDLTVFETTPSAAFIPLDGMTKIYEGDLAVSTPGALNIPLETPFFYDGTKNLIITMSCPQKRTTTPNIGFCATETPGFTQALYFREDNTPYTGIPTSGVRSEAKRPNTTFIYSAPPTSPLVKLADTLLDFGFIPLNGNSIKGSQITNIGIGTLSISGIENLSSPFTSNASEISLNQGQSALLQFTYTPTSAQAESRDLIVKTNGGDAKLQLVGYAYPQTGLVESFEQQTFPELWRMRTNGWNISTTAAYDGSNCLKVGSTQDTLITPKTQNGNLVFYLKDDNAASKEFQILYSLDLQNWTILHTLEDFNLVKSKYEKQIVDLSTLPANAFVGIVGKNMTIDYILLTQAVRPQHDLYLTSFTPLTIYNEKTDAYLPVKIKNWGSETESSFKIELRESGTDILLSDTLIAENFPSMEEKTYSIRWAPLPSVTNFYAKVVLASDTDLTNNYSKNKEVSVVPYIGVLKLSTLSLNFDILFSDSDADTLSLTIKNTGIAPLTISSVKCKAPFSIVPAYFTIPGKTDSIVQIIFRQDIPKYYKDSLVFVHDGVGDSVVQLQGLIQRSGDLFESFEGAEFPPFMWTQKTSKWKAYNSSTHAYKGNFSAYQSDKILFDTLITPKLHVQSGEKLAFYAKHWANENSDLKIIYSSNLQNWTLLANYQGANGNGSLFNKMSSYTIDLPQGDYYIGFVGKNETMIDYIQGPQVIYPDRDLKYISSLIPRKGNVNNQMQFSVSVKNIGNLVAEDYTLFLMCGEEILAQRKGESLAKLEIKEMFIPYTPTIADTLTNVYIKIVLEGDEDLTNNQSTSADILIYEEFFGEYLIGETTLTDNKYPFSTNYKYSLEEQLYYPAELGFKFGSKIKGMTFYYNQNSSYSLNIPVRIWIGETDSSSLETKWIDAVNLQPINLEDDTVSLLKGNLTKLPIHLIFSDAYTYKGGNLVLLIERGYTEVCYNIQMYSSQDLIHKKRSRYYQTDSPTTFDATQAISYTATTVANYPMVLFSVDRPTVKVSGYIKNDENIPVENALVSLKSGAVSYKDTTDAEGFFEMTMSILSKDYTFDVSHPDYAFKPRTFFIADTNENLGDIILSEHPFAYTLFLSSQNEENLAGLIVQLKSNASVDQQTDTIKTVGSTATLVFQDVAKGSYTLNLLHRDFADHQNTSLYLTEEKTDTVVLKERTPITLSGTILAARDKSVLENAVVTFSMENLIYCDTTDEEGLYSFSINKMDRIYTVEVKKESYKTLSTSFALPITKKDTLLSPYTLNLLNIILTLNVNTSQGESAQDASAVLTNKSSGTKVELNVLANGKVIFDNILPDLYILEISKNGYEKYTDSALDIRNSLTKDITLQKQTSVLPLKTSLTLHVSTSTGQNLEGLPVYLENNLTGGVYEVELNSKGLCLIDNLLEGIYTLEIFKEGFEKYIDTALEIKDSLVKNIVLQENIIAPYALEADVLYNEQDATADIKFTWNEIGDYFMDSFEDYADFTLNPDPWKTIDRDGLSVVALNQRTYPNMGIPQAATIFSPLAVTPMLEEAFAFPYSGKRCLAFFGSIGGANDDWAISPKRMIRSGEVLAFVVKQLAESNEKERFAVLISSTGNEIADFKPLSAGSFLSVGPEWQLFSADLAEYVGKEVHIAIHCLSKTQMMLMIDDFYIGKPVGELGQTKLGTLARRTSPYSVISSASDLFPTFEVYLDNVKTASIDSTNYLFTNVSAGEHTVGVKAIYQSGESEMRTLTLNVDDFRAVSAEFILNVTTNANESGDGAALTLTDTLSKTSRAYKVSEGTVQINFLRKSVYALQIEKEGFSSIEEVFDFTKAETLSRELIEEIKTPVNAYVKVENKGKTADAIFSWDNEVGFKDGFETYTDFAQQFGSWTNIDYDTANTFGLSTCSFPGAGGKTAAVVFNTSQTTPPITGDAAAAPHSGQKHLIFISSDIRTPNDWLISPKQEIRDGYELRFFAKSYSDIYGLEKMNVLISETNTDTASFRKVKSLTIPTDWTEFKIDLSEYKDKNIYVAFNYVSFNTFYMLLDDVYIGSKEDAPDATATRVKNYKIFLNGELKATQKESEYIFTNLSEGEYIAGVQAEYASGLSEIATYTFAVKLIDNEEEDVNTLSVYPNPVSGGNLNVKSSQYIRHIRIVSLDGKEIYSKYWGEVREISLPTANLQVGMYILEMQMTNTTKQIKFVVK